MRRRGWRRWAWTGLPLNLTVAVGQPLLMIGLLHFGLRVGPPAGTVMAVAGFLLWPATIALNARMGPHMVAMFLLLGVVALAVVGAQTAVMSERGVRTDCVIGEVKKRVERSTSTDSEGHTTTSTTTYYDHRLRCDDTHVDAITSTSRLGDRGERTTVDYDPLGRIGPLPAGTTDQHALFIRLLLAGLVVAIVLRVGGVLWEAADPWM